MGALGRVDGLVIDGADTHGLAAFWGAVLDTEVESEAGEGHYVDLRAIDGLPNLRFQRVPEAKGVKNRLHLDIEVADLEAATERVRELGGSVVRPTMTEYGWDYSVLADPEGNEFCVIRRSDA